MNTTTQLNNKTSEWEPAIEEPYYPSLFEGIKHWLGYCTHDIKGKCLVCGANNRNPTRLQVFIRTLFRKQVDTRKK